LGVNIGSNNNYVSLASLKRPRSPLEKGNNDPVHSEEDPPSVGDSSDMVSGICQVLGEHTILHSIIQSQQTLLETRNKLIYNQNGQITIQEKLLSLKEECNNLQKEENSNLSNLVRELSISAMRLLIILIVLG
jgi:hypothetical protein